MNRGDFQRLADERAADAEALLAARRWSGAYYLAGYAVECALKACVARRTRRHDFPSKELAQKCHTHNLEVLLDAALLLSQRDAAAAANPTFRRYWTTLKAWSEVARYRRWKPADARELVRAVNDPAHGVLPWIKARW